jgi:hypothetical protein
MAEFYLTIRIVHSVIIFCLLLSKNAADHENREKKNRENPDADQTLFHSLFTPSLSNLDLSPPDLLDLESLTNIQYLSRKKTRALKNYYTLSRLHRFQKMITQISIIFQYVLYLCNRSLIGVIRDFETFSEISKQAMLQNLNLF